MKPSAQKPGWAQRMLAWPRLLLRGSPDAGQLYDLRGEGAIEGTGSVPLVNMGYWAGLSHREDRALEKAVYALFALVARGARLDGEPAHVLDAGCGFGTNAIFLAESYATSRVTGVNVSDVQLTTARRRTEAAGRSSQVDFLLASVTQLPIPSESVDAVVSIEAAFHFDTRDAFFAEAFRVLKPGGRLSMVDLVVPPARNLWQRFALNLVCRSQAVPPANVYDRAEWMRRVRAAGFEVEAEESIVDRVFPSFRRWILSRPLSVHLRYDLAYLMASTPYLLYPFDYVRVVVRKPG